jgi:hypothetical protein
MSSVQMNFPGGGRRGRVYERGRIISCRISRKNSQIQERPCAHPKVSFLTLAHP